MDTRKYFSVKTPDSEASSGEESDVEKHEGESSLVLADDPAVPPAKRKKHSSVSEKKKQYKAKLSYKKAWEKNHPWLQCTNPQEGMFCTICMKWGKPPPSTKGGWTARGISDWNHASELIKQHESSRWHKDSVFTARMAQQCEQQSVAEIYTSAATQEAAKRKEKNRDILLKLLRSIYFLVKNRIPHSTTFSELVQLQVMNDDKPLEQHITEGPLNARYTSRFSATVLISSIDTWLERKLVQSIQSCPFFTILADECQDISSHEVIYLWQIVGEWNSRRAFLDCFTHSLHRCCFNS